MRGNPPQTRSLAAEAFECFGDIAFGHALYHNIPNSLRFELGISPNENPQDRIDEALARTTDILSDLNLYEDRAGIAIKANYWPTEGTPLHQATLKLVRQLRNFGFSIAPPLSTISNCVNTDESTFSQTLFFNAPTDTTATTKLLCSVFGADFGNLHGQPPGDVYLFNLNKKVLVHPYDDRGIDVVSPNFETLQSLYNKRSSWRLSYDCDRMDAAFG